MMESRQVGDVTVISPRGFINAHTVRQFEQALSQAVEADPPELEAVLGDALGKLAERMSGSFAGGAY